MLFNESCEATLCSCGYQRHTVANCIMIFHWHTANSTCSLLMTLLASLLMTLLASLIQIEWVPAHLSWEDSQSTKVVTTWSTLSCPCPVFPFCAVPSSLGRLSRMATSSMHAFS